MMLEAKKKVGLLTLPLIDNYGGILQCVALYGYLRALGHDVTLIRNDFCYSSWKRAVVFLLQRLPFQNIKNFRSSYHRKLKHAPFVNNYFINKTESLSTRASFNRLAEHYDFDAVIVGSDQVWRFDYIKEGYYERYFLDFLKDKQTKKISYAASFGKRGWRNSLQRDEEVASLLKEFSAVSVRESSGIEVCREALGRDDVELVLDPTMLVDQSFYEHVFPQTIMKTSKDRYIASYILDKSDKKYEIMRNLKHELKIEKVKLLNETRSRSLTLDEWLSAIKESDFVVTDSFHGMVFSIIFNKDFIVLKNQERGADRFDSLLELLRLTERSIDLDDHDRFRKVVGAPIDYQATNMIIEKLRNNSRGFLSRSLV